jgi:hypothetical protein
MLGSTSSKGTAMNVPWIKVLWAGPIRTDADARLIMAISGGIVTAIDLAVVVDNIVISPSRDAVMSSLAVGLIFPILSGFLAIRKSRWAVITLLVITGLTLVFGGGEDLVDTIARGQGYPSTAATLAIWSLLAWLSWRSLLAANFLRKTRRHPAPSIADLFS